MLATLKTQALLALLLPLPFLAPGVTAQFGPCSASICNQIKQAHARCSSSYVSSAKPMLPFTHQHGNRTDLACICRPEIKDVAAMELAECYKNQGCQGEQATEDFWLQIPEAQCASESALLFLSPNCLTIHPDFLLVRVARNGFDGGLEGFLRHHHNRFFS